MKKEVRTICYDEKLRLEAYRLEGIVQPLPCASKVASSALSGKDTLEIHATV